jgi:hypothetical protein
MAHDRALGPFATQHHVHRNALGVLGQIDAQPKIASVLLEEPGCGSNPVYIRL